MNGIKKALMGLVLAVCVIFPNHAALGGTDLLSVVFNKAMVKSGGDTNAFEELVERHQALVAGTVARMLGSNSDVEDIAQQVFVRVWKSARRYVPRAKFTTWLLKITRNLVFNELRRTKRWAHVPLEAETGTEESALKDESNPAPDASLLELELQRAIEQAIMQLPETQRMALVLRRYEQLSYEEIADVLCIPLHHCKWTLLPAR